MLCGSLAWFSARAETALFIFRNEAVDSSTIGHPSFYGGVLLSQCVTLRNGLRQLLFGFIQLALKLGDFLFSLAFRDSLVEIR